MKWGVNFAACFMLMLAACAPSASAINTAIAQTQEAIPTNIATLIPTFTPEPAATVTLTSNPSPTPDTRLIDTDPRKLLLEKNELPAEGRYFLPDAGHISPITNTEIVSAWTVAQGQAYLEETGRIDGWEVSYTRGNSDILLPERVYHNVVIYSKIEGAQIVVTKYQDRAITIGNYKEIDAPQLGDVSRAFMYSETNSGGETRVNIQYAFSYRNIFHVVDLYGWDKEVSLEFAMSIANTLLESLQTLPLSDSVTFKP